LHHSLLLEVKCSIARKFWLGLSTVDPFAHILHFVWHRARLKSRFQQEHHQRTVIRDNCQRGVKHASSNPENDDYCSIHISIIRFLKTGFFLSPILR
jgi:hypothetical protein